MEHAEGLARLLMHLDDLVDHRRDERVRGLPAHADDVVRIPLCRSIDRRIVRIDQPVLLGLGLLALGHEPPIAVFHRLDRSTGVPRHVHLGDDLDVPRVGVADEVDVLLAGVEAASVSDGRIGKRAGTVRRVQELRVVQGVTAERSDLRQFRQFLDLDAPALILREVDVQRVQLVERHDIQ